jgi:predicted transcriptional regulator
MTNKETILRALETLPDEGTLEDAIERLVLLGKINRGIEDVEQGRVMSHEEARARFEKWLK